MSTVLGAARSTSLPQPCRYPNNPVENASRSSDLQIFVSYHNRSYTLEVNAHDTIKTLKEKVQRKLNTNLSQYFFANRSFLDEQKTLSDYDIKKETTLFLSDRLQGGGPDSVLGPNFANRKHKPFLSNSGLVVGLNLQGKCANVTCRKKEERQSKSKKFGTFNIRKINQEDLKCSGCGSNLNNVAIIFYNCKFKAEGKEEATSKEVQTKWKFVPISQITVFDEEFLSYEFLKIFVEAKPPVKTQEIINIQTAIKSYEAKYDCIAITGVGVKGIYKGITEKIVTQSIKNSVAPGVKICVEEGVQIGIEEGIKILAIEGGKELLEEGVKEGVKKGVEAGVKKVTEKIIVTGGKELLEEGIKEGVKKGVEEGVKMIAEKAVIEGGKEIVEKGLQKGIEKGIEKGVAEGTKQGVATTTKYVPGVSLVFGIGMAGYRIYHAKGPADYLKAVAEVASGGAAFIPGWGTYISIGIDVLVAGHDICSVDPKKQQNNNTIFDEDYNLLNITRRDFVAKPLEKKEVDDNYKLIMNTLHPDKWEVTGQATVDEMNLLIQKVNTVRTKIYKIKKW